MLVLPPLAMALPPSLSLRPNTKSSASSVSFAPPPPPPSIRSRKEQLRVRSSPSLSSSARKRSLSVAKCTILPVINANPQDDKNEQREGTDLKTLLRRFWKVAAPYWFSEDKTAARLRLAAVFLLTLGTTGISVGFNFLGRDFYNALANKDQEQFMKQLLYYLGAFAGGIPVFVLRDYAKETLGLRWRSWMTSYYMERYFKNQTFYRIQSESIIDNPDQRIVDDLSAFTGTALGFSLTLFNAVVDLISFSNILFGIYPPLFIVLIVYSIGGTVLSVFLGRGLVNLNFMQEKKEADFRYGLVRIRENAESIAFYGGEQNELQMLLYRFKKAFENLTQLLISSRNLDFFTSGYRYLIQILPAAVVAPMYFSGKIEFGVINQSVSAFNHILGDFSLIVYQFQAISAFSAVIDRLGEFDDVLDNCGIPDTSETKEEINVIYNSHVNDTQVNGGVSWKGVQKLLEVESLSLWTPRNNIALIKDLTLNVYAKDSLLIMGPSGSGKTSLLRAMAGLWRSGKGRITYYLEDFRQLEKTVSSDTAPISLKERSENEPLSASESENEGFRFIRSGDIFFLPQRPYMVLGTLRQQLLYPTWREVGASTSSSEESKSAGLPFLSRVPNWQDDSITGNKPTEEDILKVLDRVRLSDIVGRFNGLDSIFEWSSVLSLGEQQRLAFARLLLAQPKLVFLDESTSALDEANEAHLYGEIKDAGITYISIGHRRTLRNFHSHVLRISSADSEEASQKNWSLELDP